GGAPSSLHGVPFNSKRTALMLASFRPGGVNRSMLEHVSSPLKTMVPTKRRGSTLALARIPYRQKVLWRCRADRSTPECGPGRDFYAAAVARERRAGRVRCRAGAHRCLAAAGCTLSPASRDL